MHEVRVILVGRIGSESRRSACQPNVFAAPPISTGHFANPSVDHRSGQPLLTLWNFFGCAIRSISGEAG